MLHQSMEQEKHKEDQRIEAAYWSRTVCELISSLAQGIKITLTAAPIPKARHRSRIHDGRIHTYDPQVLEKEYAKRDVKRTMLENGLKAFQDEPILMVLCNYVSMPQSWSVARKNEFEGKYCKTRPDVDNYVKFYGDVLNGIAYRDDSRIVSLFTEKRYSKNPRVEITLSKLSEETKCSSNAFATSR